MFKTTPSALLTLLSLAALTGASPTELLRRNNGSGDYKSKCEGFRVQGIDDVVQVGESIYYPEGTLVNLTSLQDPIESSDVPSFCRVQLLIYTDPDVPEQFANTEVWLPDNYNGRYACVGNGGYGGGIDYEAMAFSAVYEGFAAMGSNGGHNSSSPDGTWALNNPAAITDFGALRGIVKSTAVAKQVIQQYYGKPASKNYFIGCSTGGRQGLQLAQRFPDLYDGILAGAPAADWVNLMSWEGHIRNLVEPVNGSSWIPGATWGVIHQEILKQCDAVLDGVDDGVIENPNLCNFRPEVLSCRPNAKNTTACLNADQLAAVKKIYSDYYETNQRLIFPQYDYGAELGYTGLFGPNAFPIPEQYFRNFYLNDSSFDISSLNTDLINAATEANVGQLISVNPDIREFVNRGGKLLQYHGLADQLISSGSSARYYNSVDSFTRMNTNKKTDDFYRYFPVPGLLHCRGGPGVNSIGSSQQSQGLGYSPKTDFRAALVDWVENGKAPEVITGTHYETSEDGKSTATFNRPLCKYPGQSKYKGKGDWRKASSWYCQAAPPNFSN